VVHTHQGKAGALGRLAAFDENVPVIVHTYHGHTFKTYFPWPLGTAILRVEREAARKSDALICQSRSQESDVAHALGDAAKGRTVLIPPAIRISSDFQRQVGRSRVRKELCLNDGEPLLLMPARLAPVKQPIVALKLAFALAERLGPLVFCVLGDGPLKGELLREIARGGERYPCRVLVCDPVSEPWDTYAAADLVFLSSRMEGTPLALLEAAACGSPVAAPDVGGVADVLQGLGTVLPTGGSIAAWADALVPVIRSGMRRKTLDPEEALAVGRRYSPEALSGQVRDLYFRLLTKKVKPRDVPNLRDPTTRG
jgi:glycosyltransferase involved in cell wall biosynthesis